MNFHEIKKKNLLHTNHFGRIIPLTMHSSGAASERRPSLCALGEKRRDIQLTNKNFLQQ